MGESESRFETTMGTEDHAKSDAIAQKAVNDGIKKAQIWADWQRLGLPSPAEGGVPWYWFWSRFWYGKYPPTRWVEGVTIVEENELGEQWVTHVDIRQNGSRNFPNDERFSHNWSRRKMNTTC
ncbi:unnamed protein product [Durusdinium trenchii]|uniref:Uncharacterized protein n=1 Tax=Durusdinium trenchii TaxID=1381693 RepID=A0ABP0PEF6_9DINO